MHSLYFLLVVMYMPTESRSLTHNRFLLNQVLTRTRTIEKKTERKGSAMPKSKHTEVLEKICEDIKSRQTNQIKAQICNKQHNCADKFRTGVFYEPETDKLILLLLSFVELLSQQIHNDYSDTMKQWRHGGRDRKQNIMELRSHQNSFYSPDRVSGLEAYKFIGNPCNAERDATVSNNLPTSCRSKKTNIEINFDFTQVIEMIEEQSLEQTKKKDGMIQKLQNLLLMKEQEIEQMLGQIEEKGEELKQAADALAELQQAKDEEASKKNAQMLRLSNNFAMKENGFKKQLELLEKAGKLSEQGGDRGQGNEGFGDDFLKRCLYTQAISLEHFLGFDSNGYVKKYQGSW